MTDYKITKSECESRVEGLVCTRCGGKLTAIETVDNAGSPTHWPGCEPCSHFDYGAKPEVFNIARKLVDDHGYRHYNDGSLDDDEETKAYHRSCEIAHACGVVRNVLFLASDHDERCSK